MKLIDDENNTMVDVDNLHTPPVADTNE